jgi:hypothetical protein
VARPYAHPNAPILTGMNLNVRFSTETEPIHRLAKLAGRAAPRGPVMLAELDGEPVAAIAIADGTTVADPVRSSPAVTTLLNMRRIEARLLAALGGV